MARAKKRRNGFRCGPSMGSGGASMIKPVMLGLVIAAVVAFVFIMIFALVFVIMKAIVSSAVIPLSLIALMIGCFVGGLVCGTVARSRGLLYGLAIGFIVFLSVWLFGMAMGADAFSLITAIKLICLLLAGGCGGWMGSNHAYTKRRFA